MVTLSLAPEYHAIPDDAQPGVIPEIRGLQTKAWRQTFRWPRAAAGSNHTRQWILLEKRKPPCSVFPLLAVHGGMGPEFAEAGRNEGKQPQANRLSPDNPHGDALAAREGV